MCRVGDQALAARSDLQSLLAAVAAHAHSSLPLSMLPPAAHSSRPPSPPLGPSLWPSFCVAMDSSLSRLHRFCTSKAGRVWVSFGVWTPLQGWARGVTQEGQSDAAGHHGAPGPLSSTGFSVLQDELPAQHQQAHEYTASREGEACGLLPIVSDEDLSIGCSMFQDGTSKTDGDSPTGECLPQERVRSGLARTGTPEELAPEPQPQCW